MKISAWNNTWPLPHLPVVKKPTLDMADRVVLQGLGSASSSIHGASMIMSTIASYAAIRAPYTVLPRLALLCTTPLAGLAITGTYIGAQLVVVPAVQMLTQYTRESFISHEVNKSREAWAMAASSKATLRDQSDLAQACQQQVVNGAETHAMAVASFLCTLTQAVCEIALGVYGIVAIGGLAGMSIGLIGFTLAAPILLTALTMRAKSSAGQSVVQARKELIDVVHSFSDKTSTGNKPRQESWLNDLRSASTKVSTAVLQKDMTDGWCNLLENSPANLMRALIGVSFFQRDNLPGYPTLISQSTIGSCNTASSLMSGVKSFAWVLSGYQYLKQTTAARDTIKARLDSLDQTPDHASLTGKDPIQDNLFASTPDRSSTVVALRTKGLLAPAVKHRAKKTINTPHLHDGSNNAALLSANQILQISRQKKASYRACDTDLWKHSEPRSLSLQAGPMPYWNKRLSRENKNHSIKMLRSWCKDESVLQIKRRVGKLHVVKAGARQRGHAGVHKTFAQTSRFGCHIFRRPVSKISTISSCLNNDSLQ